MPKRGLFITFEGTEGAGKSTLIQGLSHALKNQGLEVIITREPGGSLVAEKIRELILKENMDPWTEVFLYEASRAEHLAQTIRPALQRKAVVLCDRFADSSLAYQAHARGLPWKTVHQLNQIATQKLRPDLTFLLDIDPAQGLKRAQDGNRFEAEGVAFQTKVRQGFLKAKRQDPRRWRTFQVSKMDAQTLCQKALEEIQKTLKRRR